MQAERIVCTSGNLRNYSEELSNFTCQLDHTVSRRTHMAVTNVTYPQFTKSFKSTRNILVYQINNIPDLSVREISLPTDRAFANLAALITWLNAETTIAADGLVFSQDTDTGLLKVTEPVTGFRVYGYDDLSAAQKLTSCNMQLGFVDAQSDFLGAGATQTASDLTNLVYTYNLYLNCSLVSSVLSNNQNLHNVVAVIPIEADYGAVSSYTSEPSKTLLKLNDQEFRQIQFRILDDDGEQVDLGKSGMVTIELALLNIQGLVQNDLNAGYRPEMFTEMAIANPYR